MVLKFEKIRYIQIISIFLLKIVLSAFLGIALPRLLYLIPTTNDLMVIEIRTVYLSDLPLKYIDYKVVHVME